MRDDERFRRMGRFSREQSKAISEAVSKELQSNNMAATDLALILGQSLTSVTRKVRGITTWSRIDLELMDKAFGAGWMDRHEGAGITISESSNCAASAFGNATVTAAPQPAAAPSDAITIEKFISDFGRILNNPARIAAQKYAAIFPADTRPASDWLQIIAAFSKR